MLEESLIDLRLALDNEPLLLPTTSLGETVTSPVIAVKNEDMSARLNGTVHASVPDIITLINKATGAPISNPHVSIGQQVGVLILPAPKALLTSRGLEVFGPAYAGISGPFVSPL